MWPYITNKPTLTVHETPAERETGLVDKEGNPLKVYVKRPPAGFVWFEDKETPYVRS